MLKTIVKTLFTLLLVWMGSPSRAQSQGKDMAGDLKAFVQKIQQAYQQAGYLGFKIRYYYANASQPDLYLDSLSAEIEMDKGRSRFSIDGIETILTNRYNIQIMKEDKTIYLAAARHAASGNPVSMLDSVFAHTEEVKTSISHLGQTDILTLVFPEGQPYTRLELKIDNRTGFFQRVIYALNTSSLVGREMISAPGNPSPYQSRGQMEIVFTDYQQGRFDDKVFREETFFNKTTAGKFEPAGEYKDYHIFLASSNL